MTTTPSRQPRWQRGHFARCWSVKCSFIRTKSFLASKYFVSCYHEKVNWEGDGGKRVSYILNFGKYLLFIEQFHV